MLRRHIGVSYLGVIIKRNYISIHPKRIKKLKNKIRTLTPRTSGLNVKTIVKRLNPVIRS